MSVRGIAVTLAAFAALGAGAHAASGASHARAAIHPALGDWEGSGPHGLGLSFEFVRRGRHIVVRDLALGLPSGCRSAGNPAWVAWASPRVEYVAPGAVLRGPLRPLGPAQFEIIIPPRAGNPFPVIMQGRVSSARHGTLSIPSPKLRCASGAWPRTLRFTIAAHHRVAVSDGLWTGNVSPPAGASGTVQIRVIDSGRIETDFHASFTCPDGSSTAGFEIGPLPTIGNLITADGATGGVISGVMVWSGRFTASGQLTGTLISLGCASSATYAFSAARTGS